MILQKREFRISQKRTTLSLWRTDVNVVKICLSKLYCFFHIFWTIRSEQDMEIRYDVNELIVYSTIYKVLYMLGDQTDFWSINRRGSIILNHHDSSIIFAFLRSSGVSWHSKETRNKNPWAPEETNKSESEVSFSYGTIVSFLREKSVPFQWKELITQFSSPLDTQNSHRYIFETIFYIKSFGYYSNYVRTSLSRMVSNQTI